MQEDYESSAESSSGAEECPSDLEFDKSEEVIEV